MSKVVVRNNPDRIAVQVGSQTIVLDEQEFSDLVTQVMSAQWDRLNDPDTDGIEEASSGVALGIRAAAASLLMSVGDAGVIDLVLEAAGDAPEEQARHIAAVGWAVY
jgi:hypothetical protein